MPHKVLVFESDSAFASELRNELAKLDCNTVIVDDGNVGLQQAAADKPDLILLSIELPRMNGFSVCNKLKKDANLRDVPLIIMSSESSGETFEQHRKLRTRAEDYVHKPIAFGELLQHIRAFVPLGGGGDGGGVDIDDEVHERGNTFPPAQQREGGSAGRNTGRTSVLQSNPKEIDPDIDQFADEAFGMLQSGSNPGTDLSSLASEHEAEAQQRAAREELSGLTQMHGDVQAPPHELPGEEPRTMYHAQANVNPYATNDAPAESTPGTSGAVTAENVRAQADYGTATEGQDEAAEQLRVELEDAHRKSETLERELGTARSDLDRVQDEVGQLRQELEASREAIGSLERGQEERAAQMQAAASDATSAAAATSAQSTEEIRRLQAEVERLKTELTAGAAATAAATTAAATATAAAGATPTKAPAGVSSREFLDLREASNRKDKEILSLKEALSRKDKEILEARERSLSLERTAGETDDKMLALERELNQEKERGESLSADKDAAKKVGEDLKTRLAKAQADIEAREKDVADAKEKIAEEMATREAALASAKAEREEALDALKKEHGEALEAAAEEAKKDRAAAVTAREQEMQKESDGKLAALHRAQQDELGRLKGDFERERKDSGEKHDAALAAADKRRTEELAKAEEDAEAALAAKISEMTAREKDALEAAEKDYAEKTLALENDRDSRIAALEARTTRELAEVRAVAEAQKLAADEQITELTRDLGSTRGQLTETTQDRDRLTGELDTTKADLATRSTELEASKSKVASLTQELEATNIELTGTRERLAQESTRAERATSMRAFNACPTPR